MNFGITISSGYRKFGQSWNGRNSMIIKCSKVIIKKIMAPNESCLFFCSFPSAMSFCYASHSDRKPFPHSSNLGLSSNFLTNRTWQSWCHAIFKACTSCFHPLDATLRLLCWKKFRHVERKVHLSQLWKLCPVSTDLPATPSHEWAQTKLVKEQSGQPKEL